MARLLGNWVAGDSILRMVLEEVGRLVEVRSLVLTA